MHVLETQKDHMYMYLVRALCHVSLTSSVPTVLYSVTLHTYRGKFDWQNLFFMNMHKAGENNLLTMKLHVTIKYSSISMMSYRDFLLKKKVY